MPRSANLSKMTPDWIASMLMATLLLTTIGNALSVEAGTAINFGTYAAVAYSPATGKYGYAWNQSTRGRAEYVALSHCPEKDAVIVGWVKGGWLVLAVGDNNAYGTGWEYGNGARNTDACERAIDKCHKNGGKVRTLVVLCSGNVGPEIIKSDANRSR